MLPATIVRALTTPAFEPDQFVATKWSTAEDKAKFANALMKFIANEFPRPAFSKALYQRLSNTFGHIANYNRDRFYSVFFERDADKVVFLDQTLALALLRRSDLHILRCRARRPAAPAGRERDRRFPHARGRCDPQARARCARAPASEIRREPRACPPPRPKPRRRRPTCSRHDAKNRLRRRTRPDKHGTPVRRKGRVRPAAALGGPNPGASRRLCPGRNARALTEFRLRGRPSMR